MTKSSQIYISDNRNIIPILQELRDKVDALPDNEMLLHFQTEYDDFILHKDNFLRKNTDEEINAVYTFKKYPILPTEEPGNHNPISLSYFNSKMNTFIRGDEHEVISGGWEFTHPVKGVAGEKPTDFVIKSQLPTFGGDQTINGKWSFINQVKGPDAQHEDEFVTLRQLNNVVLPANSEIQTPVFTGTTPPSYKPDGTTQPQEIMTSGGLHRYLTKLTELPQLVEYKTPTNYQLVQKKYVDDLVNGKEFRPDGVPYLTQDNLFSGKNVFNDNASFKNARQIGKYENSSFIFDSPQTTRDGSTAFSDYVNINYLDKNYAKKENAPFVRDSSGNLTAEEIINFKNGLKVKNAEYAAVSTFEKTLLAAMALGSGAVGSLGIWGVQILAHRYCSVEKQEHKEATSYVEFEYSKKKLDDVGGMMGSILGRVPIPLNEMNTLYRYTPLCVRIGKIQTAHNDLITNIGNFSYDQNDRDPATQFNYKWIDGMETSYMLNSIEEKRLGKAQFSLCKERIGGTRMPNDIKCKTFPITTYIEDVNDYGIHFDKQSFYVGYVQSYLWDNDENPHPINDPTYIVKQALLTGIYFNSKARTGATTRRAQYPLACYIESDNYMGLTMYEGENNNEWDYYRFAAIRANNSPDNIKLAPEDNPRIFQREAQFGEFGIKGRKENEEYSSEIFTGSSVGGKIHTRMEADDHNIYNFTTLNDWNYQPYYSQIGVKVHALPGTTGKCGYMLTNIEHTAEDTKYNSKVVLNQIKPQDKKEEEQDTIFEYSGFDNHITTKVSDLAKGAENLRETSLYSTLQLANYKVVTPKFTKWKLKEFHLITNSFDYADFDDGLPVQVSQQTRFLNYIIPSNVQGQNDITFNWLSFRGYYKKAGAKPSLENDAIKFESKEKPAKTLFATTTHTISITSLSGFGDYINYGTKLEYDGSKFDYSVLPNPCKQYKPIIHATVDDTNACPVDQKIELEINSALKVADDVTVGTQLKDLSKLGEDTLVPAKYVQEIKGSLSTTEQNLTNVTDRLDPVEKLTTAALKPPPSDKPNNKPDLSVTHIDVADITGMADHSFEISPSMVVEKDKNDREKTYYGLDVSSKDGDSYKPFGRLHEGGIRATSLAVLGTVGGAILNLVGSPFSVLKKIILKKGHTDVTMTGGVFNFPDSYEESDQYEINFNGDTFYTLPDNGVFKIKTKNSTTNEDVDLFSIENSASNKIENAISTFNSIILATNEKQNTDNPEPTEVDNIKVATHKYVDNYVANHVFDGSTEKARYSKKQFVVLEENATTLSGKKTILGYPGTDTEDPNKTKCGYGGIRFYNDLITTAGKGHEVELRLKNYIMDGHEYSEVVMIDHLGKEHLLYQIFSRV